MLQAVYIARTGKFDDEVIIISIFQSILSMTMSMIKSDHIYMRSDKFKNHKKVLPIPNTKFIKHFFARFIEITSRIGIFSLYWIVLGGEVFVVFLIFEFLIVLIYLNLEEFLNLKSDDENAKKNKSAADQLCQTIGMHWVSVFSTSV